jgi:hypothetical protein
MEQRIIGTRGVRGGLSSGIGYIVIPNDITNREQFISNCFSTSTVSILLPDASRFDSLEVNKILFQYLDFPNTVNDLGSRIFWVKISKHNQPVVIAILNKKGEVLSLQNGQFKIEKLSGNNIVSILGDGKKGNLFINVQSDIEGNIIINARNKDKKNKVKLNVDGNIETISNNGAFQVLEEFKINIKNGLIDKNTETIIKYKRDTGFNYFDQYKNNIIINKDGFQYDDNNKNKIVITKDGLKYTNDKGTFEIDKDGKFSMSNDQYSIKDLITDLIKEVEAIKTPTSIGLNPPSNVANFALIRTQKLPKILK